MLNLSRGHGNSFIVAAALLTSLILFQNCTKGFNSASYSSGFGVGSDASGPGAGVNGGTAAGGSSPGGTAPGGTPPVDGGSAGNSGGTTTPPVTDVAPDVNPNIGASCTSSVVRGSANASLQKLTKPELLATIKALFPSDNQVTDLVPYNDYYYTDFKDQNPVQIALNQYPDEFSRKPGEEFQSAHNDSQVMAWMDVADELAVLTVANGLLNPYVTNNCLAQATPTPACVQEFVTRFGRAAWRRPLAATEIQSLASSVTSSALLQPLVARMLRAPDFVFQVRTGTTEEATRIHLTSHEVASLIAFRITGTVPDSTLAAAADQGQLSTTAQVQTQVNRLVRLQQGKDGIYQFFNRWLDIDKAADPNWMFANNAQVGDRDAFNPFMYSNEGLRDSYLQEAQDFVNHIVWTTSGTFSDLMSSPVSFPKDKKVASAYGVTVNSGPVTTPQHPGLLTRGALLATDTAVTNPIKRGVKIMRKVLCSSIPSPDFSVVAARNVQLAGIDYMRTPNYQRVNQVTGGPVCISCHATINPYGFLFENYSPLGQMVTQQKAIDMAYNGYLYGMDNPAVPAGVDTIVPFTYALPGSQSITIEPGLPTSFNSSTDLINAIAQSNQARNCVSVRMFRYFNRRAESTADSCAVADVETKLKTGQPVLDSIVNLLSSEDVLWRKK